jgi:hypothetical protein
VSKLAVLVVVIIALSCGGNGLNPVITVGDRELYPADVEHVFDAIRGDTAEVDHTVESIVDRELILMDAEARGYYDLPTSQRILYEKEREVLTSKLYDYLMEHVQASEDTVRALYDRLGDFVWYTKFIVDDSLAADSLRNLALAGYDFDTLVRDNTNDPFFPQTQGRNGEVDRMLTPNDDRHLIENLQPGDISGIGRIPSGWMVIRLDSTAVREIPSWEETAPWLENYVRAHLREDYKVTLEDSLREARHLTVMPGTGELVASHATDTYGSHTEFSDEDAWKTAYTWDGGERPIVWLADNIAGMPEFLPRDATDPAWVEEYCLTLGLYDIMRTIAIEEGLDAIPENARFIERNQSRYILDLYYPDVVAPRIVVTDEQEQRIYDENIDLFMLPVSRVYSTVSAVGPEQVHLLKDVIEAGGDPFARLGDLTPTESILAPGESLLTRPIALVDIPERFQDQLFGCEPGEVVVCSTTVDSRIAFRLEEELPERPKSFEDSRSQLYNMAYLEQEEQVVVGLVDSLKEEYAPVIDRDYFNQFYIPVEPAE